jgi:molybdopterin-dependent oxidoreductase alpha subunit
MSERRKVPGVETYDGPAGGWGALQAVAKSLRNQMAVVPDTQALLRVNQPEGFDCPGCAWPDPRHSASFEFCENGAKAVSWEATSKRANREFFATNTVAELWNWSDYSLENEGRLTEPLVYDRATDKFVPIRWEDAMAKIGASMRSLAGPNEAEFYTSGRASNEAAFLYQLYAREFGTNNFPDCSNMCHEATSVGLPESIGVGKGTVQLEDFDHCDAIFSIGHNPGTNHPRMLGTLREASKRGAAIVVFNAMRERGLERFANPQDPVEMLTGSATRIASSYHLVKVGGDAALMKGLMKALMEIDAQDIAKGGRGVLDRAFIAEHTTGLDALIADLDRTSWDSIVLDSGVSKSEIEHAAGIYSRAKRVILCYGMGVTQHRFGTGNVHQLMNFLLLRGNIGREGAGICPLRGHSNVQGDRTVGITEIPNDALLDGIKATFGFDPPREKGHNAVEAVEAIKEGHSKALICLGGNLAVAMPDPEVTFPAMRKLKLAVHIATKLNRSHLLLAEESFILPCLGRTELDMQETGAQSVTVEDSMSMVHASKGRLKPASEGLRSEPWIVAELARATLPNSKVDWRRFVADYGRIRDAIEQVFPDFRDYNDRVARPHGFHLVNHAANRVWKTASKRANFIVFNGDEIDPMSKRPDVLMLTTIRSHDQYNTTIYGMDDRYRGIKGRRDVVFANEQDMADRGLKHGDLIDITTVGDPSKGRAGRTMQRLTIVAHQIARGSVAAYYPEANNLITLADHDLKSGTPAYKSVAVIIKASTEAAVA